MIDHAYKRGKVYSIQESKKYSFFQKLVRKFDPNFEIMNMIPCEVWQNFISNSNLSSSCKLGPNAFCTGSKDKINIGAHTICRGILHIEPYGNGRIEIGSHVYIGDNSIIAAASKIKIGDRTQISHNVHIWDNNSHPVNAEERFLHWQQIIGQQKGETPHVSAKDIIIENDCWIGFNSAVMKGVTIGSGSIVAANTVVTKNFPSNVIIGGSPAAIIKKLDV